MAKPGGYYILRNDIFFDDLRNKIWQPPCFRIISIRLNLVGVLRSWSWRFPDIKELWREGDWVHLIIGLYDLDENKKRILAWLGY